MHFAHQTDPRRLISSFGWTCFGMLAARLCQLNSVWLAQVANCQAPISTECISPCCHESELGSARPLLHELHWLPVASGIEFKIATLTYKILDSGLPSYLSSQLSHYHPARELHSSSSNLLAQPYSNTNFGSLAFQSSAPKIWNKLPLEVKSAHSLQTNKIRLKTHYFSKPLA